MSDRLRRLAPVLTLAVLVPVVGLSSTGYATSPAAQTPEHTKVNFVDNFDGYEWSMPDPLKWAPIEAEDGFGNDELQVYTKSPHNLRLDGRGHLLVQALRYTSRGEVHYTSGKVVSMTYPFMYGHAEARIKVPAGSGLWPAFWMLGLGEGPFATIDPFNKDLGINSLHPVKPLGWPASGEIDVMESIGRKPFTVFGSIHGPVKKLTGEVAPSNHSGSATLRQPLSAGYHVYAVDSAPGVLKFSVDGVTYSKVKRADMEPNESWVYDRPFKLILNLAVGGNWGGVPDEKTTFPAQMLVDYVRVTSTD